MKKVSLITFFLSIISVGGIMAQSKEAKFELNISLTEKIAFNTVRIEVVRSNSSGIGTGFFFNFLNDGNNTIPAIVTNKHVIQPVVLITITQFELKTIIDSGK